MIVDLPLDEKDSEVVIVKNEPENEDEYKDGYESNVAVCGDEEDIQFLWS